MKHGNWNANEKCKSDINHVSWIIKSELYNISKLTVILWKAHKHLPYPFIDGVQTGTGLVPFSSSQVGTWQQTQSFSTYFQSRTLLDKKLSIDNFRFCFCNINQVVVSMVILSTLFVSFSYCGVCSNHKLSTYDVTLFERKFQWWLKLYHLWGGATTFIALFPKLETKTQCVRA